MLDSMLKELVYQRICDRLSISLDEFISGTEDWEFRPFYMNEKLMCVVMIKEHNVHVITTKEFNGRGLTRKLFKEILGEIFKKYGFVSTKVMRDHQTGIRLAEWLGFKMVSEYGQILDYRMEQTNVWSQ